MPSIDLRRAGAALAAIGLVALAGCGGGGGGSGTGDGTTGSTGPTGGAPGVPGSVLMVGRYETADEVEHPCYWTGQGLDPVDLPLPHGSTGGYARAAASERDTVVIVGTATLEGNADGSGKYEVPVYWTRKAAGAFTVAYARLPAGTGNSYIGDVALRDGVAHAVGNVFNESMRAAYWSDLGAAPALLPVASGTGDAWAWKLAFDGASVYVAGWYYVAGLLYGQPYLWKDGAPLSPAPLPASPVDDGADIFAIGVTAAHEVVLAGRCLGIDHQSAACRWTGAGARATALASGTGGEVDAVVVSEKGVHFAGSDSDGALYWESADAAPRRLAGLGTASWKGAHVYAATAVSGTVVLAGDWQESGEGTSGVRTWRYWPCFWASPDAALTTLHLPEGAVGGRVLSMVALDSGAQLR